MNYIPKDTHTHTHKCSVSNSGKNLMDFFKWLQTGNFLAAVAPAQVLASVSLCLVSGVFTCVGVLWSH